MLLGTLVHTLLESCIEKNIVQEASMRSELLNIISDEKIEQDLLSIGYEREELFRDMKIFFGSIAWFLEEKLLKNSPPMEVIDIEESFMSTQLGMNGRADLSVRKRGSAVRIPLEVKSGKPFVMQEHTKQVALYALLMSEEEQFTGLNRGGLLLLLRSKEIVHVATSTEDFASVIRLRNELVAREKSFSQGMPSLPEPISSPRACAQCPFKVICGLYQRIEHQGRTRAATDEITSNSRHLCEADVDLFHDLSRAAGERDSRCAWFNVGKLMANGTGERNLREILRQGSAPFSDLEHVAEELRWRKLILCKVSSTFEILTLISNVIETQSSTHLTLVACANLSSAKEVHLNLCSMGLGDKLDLFLAEEKSLKKGKNCINVAPVSNMFCAKYDLTIVVEDEDADVVLSIGPILAGKKAVVVGAAEQSGGFLHAVRNG